MAHHVVLLKHPDNLSTVEVPVGFSWTALFFGFMLCAYRQDWLMFIWCLGFTIILGPIPNLVLCGFYNRWYLNHLLKQGYDVLDVKDLI